MTEEEFIKKLEEIGFNSIEILSISNNSVLKSLLAILAQSGVLKGEFWEGAIQAERLKVLEPYIKLKMEKPGVPWEDIRKMLE